MLQIKIIWELEFRLVVKPAKARILCCCRKWLLGNLRNNREWNIPSKPCQCCEICSTPTVLYGLVKFGRNCEIWPRFWNFFKKLFSKLLTVTDLTHCKTALSRDGHADIFADAQIRIFWHMSVLAAHISDRHPICIRMAIPSIFPLFPRCHLCPMYPICPLSPLYPSSPVAHPPASGACSIQVMVVVFYLGRLKRLKRFEEWQVSSAWLTLATVPLNSPATYLTLGI